jgi:transcriptional regulator with XRE-family HTH domain
MIREETQILQKFGRRIRYYRRLRNLTQEQLGERANISYKYIGEVERGNKKVSLIMIFRLSRALGISIADLMSYDRQYSDVHQKNLRSILRLLEGKELEEIKKAQRLLKICLQGERST